jgi:hypothetical protein
MGEYRLFIPSLRADHQSGFKEAQNLWRLFMKKSKLLAVCLIGILMAVGLVVMGCNLNCDNDSNCSGTRKGFGFNYDYCPDSSCAVTKAYNASTTWPVDCDC